MSNDGATLQESLDWALTKGNRVIQLVTWNDRGEGTAIEPTKLLGYRHLETIQERTKTAFIPSDLRLPIELYRLRKRTKGDAAAEITLDKAASELLSGYTKQARASLAEANNTLRSRDANFLDFPGEVDQGYRFNENISYRTEQNLDRYSKERCQLDLYHPEKPGYSTVIWFHGGGIQKGERFLPKGLRKQGVAVVSENYRLHPKITSPAYIEDAAAAVAWTMKKIEKFGGDPNKIFVSGHSLEAIQRAWWAWINGGFKPML